METLKKITDILVVLFLVFAALVLLNIISVEYLDSTFTNFSPENFYKTIFGIASGVLLLSLLVSNLYTMSMKRESKLLNNRINELKAKLYDRRVHTNSESRPSSGISDAPPFPPTNLQ